MNSRYHSWVNKSERLSYLDSEAHPAKVEDRVAEHVRKFPTTWWDTERRARAYRPQLRRITVAAQTGLVLVRTRVARLHSHGTDLVVVPSWLCALRALQGHRRHDRPARLRRRRAVPHRSCYRSTIGRSIPASEITWLGRRHIKGRLPPRCRSGLPTAPSRNEERDSSNNRDTGNTGEAKKIVEISVLATRDGRLFLRDVLRLSCRTFSLGGYLHHGHLSDSPPSHGCYLYILSLSFVT